MSIYKNIMKAVIKHDVKGRAADVASAATYYAGAGVGKAAEYGGVAKTFAAKQYAKKGAYGSAIQGGLYKTAIYGVGGLAAYNIGKSTYGAAYNEMIAPYSMQNPSSVDMGGGPSDTMTFAPTVRGTYAKGLTAGQFADNGDLTLSLSKLRRG